MPLRRPDPLAASVAARVSMRVLDADVRRVDVRRDRVRVDVSVRFGARIDDVVHLCRVAAAHALVDAGRASTPVEVRVVDVSTYDVTSVSER